MREMLLTHKDILIELDRMKNQVDEHDSRIDLIYNYLIEFIKNESEERINIGYKN